MTSLRGPQLLAASHSDVGLRRTLNEDSLLASQPIFIVADGMGGHEAGEIASGIVIDELASFVGSDTVTLEAVRTCLNTARDRMSQLAATDKKLAAGTTVSGVIQIMQDGNPYWLMVNLGDSRTYRFVEGELKQLSVDHSEVQELVDAGRITPQEAQHHANRNVITRALGAGIVANPDYSLFPIEAGERLLICSDGLTSEVADAQIAEILGHNSDPQQAADSLIAATLAAGAKDNVSVIVVDVLDSGSSVKSEEDTAQLSTGSFEDTTEDTTVENVQVAPAVGVAGFANEAVGNTSSADVLANGASSDVISANDDTAAAELTAEHPRPAPRRAIIDAEISPSPAVSKRAADRSKDASAELISGVPVQVRDSQTETAPPSFELFLPADISQAQDAADDAAEVESVEEVGNERNLLQW